MTSEQIELKVREILANKFGLDLATIKSDSRLREDLGVDSFGAVEVMFEIEEAFSLKIADSDLQQVQTVHDIVAYLEHWTAKAQS